MKICLLLIAVFLLGNDDGRTDRRGFFKKLRDNYIAGRLEAATAKEEKRIINRYEKEKLRRRKLFEKNVKTIVDGVGKRLKKKPSYILWSVAGGIALIVWLCHKGSIGCDRGRDKVVVMVIDDTHSKESFN